MTNTEKPTTKAEAKKNVVAPAPTKETKTAAPVKIDKKEKETPKKVVPKTNTPKVKKTEAVVNGPSLPISAKYAVGICKFIKGKRIGDAIRDLEQVLLLKKAVPMRGELPHQKGKGIAGAKFPQRASKAFIVLLKSLAANASANELEDPVIVEAISNIASRPFGRFGSVRRKATHVKIEAKEVNKNEKKKTSKKSKLGGKKE